MANVAHDPISGFDKRFRFALGGRSAVELTADQVLATLHTGSESVITLHHRELLKPHTWHDLGGVMLKELRADREWIEQLLAVDGYFSINSMFRQRYRRKSIIDVGIDRRPESCLRWLNAAVSDIDDHELGEDFCFEILLYETLKKIAALRLPLPNLIASSGRGLWVLWTLHDHANVGSRPKGHANNIAALKRINHALAVALGGDPQASDCARVMRYPGSLHSAAMHEYMEVRFWKLSDETHSIPQLADLLNVPVHRTKVTPHEKGKAVNPLRQKAARRRWEIALERFRKFCQLRGKLVHPTRFEALWIYALLLRRTRCQTIRDELRSFNATYCDPPKPEKDIDRAINAAMKSRFNGRFSSISKETIAKRLQITDEERSQMPEWFKTKKPKKAEVAHRRYMLKRELEMVDPNRPISLSELTRRLRERGFKVSKPTVGRDVMAIHRLKNAAIAGREATTAIAPKMRRSPDGRFKRVRPLAKAPDLIVWTCDRCGKRSFSERQATEHFEQCGLRRAKGDA